MSTSLTKTDLQKALSGLATKQDIDNKMDEALAEFRMSLNKDFEKFATKEDLEKFATKEDVEKIVGKSKTELTSYIHEVADTIIDAFDSSYSEHLSKHHSKISIASIQ